MQYVKFIILLAFVAGLLGCQPEDDPGNGIDPDPVNAGLVAYFPLDSSYVDESGNEVDLLVHGSPEFAEGIDETPFTALLLDGYDDYLVANIGTLDTFSISMWIRSQRYFVGEWPQWRSTLFDYAEKQVHGYIDGVTGATQINFEVEAEPVTEFIPDNIYDWFHLVLTVGEEVNIYYNGILGKTEPLVGETIYSGDMIHLGRASGDEQIELTYFYGLLDEIRIYNRILGPDVVAELSTKQP